MSGRNIFDGDPDVAASELRRLNEYDIHWKERKLREDSPLASPDVATDEDEKHESTWFYNVYR